MPLRNVQPYRKSEFLYSAYELPFREFWFEIVITLKIYQGNIKFSILRVMKIVAGHVEI